MPQEITQSNILILILSLILIISILGAKFSAKINTPSLLFFLAVGMLLGNDGLGLFPFYNEEIAQLIGMMGLVMILFDGGIKAKWKTIRPVAFPAASLATLGVLFTSFILGVFSKFIFDFTWPQAFLMGAIVGSTDAAAVFAMLQGRNINKRLGATLEGESGANDPMAMFLTISFISIVTGESSGFFGQVGMFLWQMGGGLFIGLILGKFGNKALNRLKFSSSGLYPLLGIAFAFLTYSAAFLVNASGLLAVYISALVIGNLGLKEHNSILRFNEGMSWIAQIGIFITLGLLIVPSDLFSPEIIVKGFLLSAILMFIARPVAVFLSVIGMQLNLKEKTFLSWAGLRGAVPIVLALFPMIAGLEQSQLYFNIIFFVVLTSTLIQGTTILTVAKRLDLLVDSNSTTIETLEALSMGKSNLESMEFRVGDSSKLADTEIKTIPLPNKTLINLIIRGDDALVPSANTTIRENDILYLLVPHEEKENIKRLLSE